MENTSFAPALERYMIDHMNDDHADSNLMYVKVYGNLWEATAARLLRLDKTGMELEVTSASGIQRLRLTFDHRLQDEKDAERTLVAMSRHAQAVIAEKAPSEQSGRLMHVLRSSPLAACGASLCTHPRYAAM